MAKKDQKPGALPGKRVVTTVEERVEDVDSGGELDLSEAPPDEDQDALSALSDLAGGSEAKCEIRRTSPAEYAGYCCSYSLSELSLDRLQAEWGGGKFSVRVRTAKGEFKGSVNIQIAGKPKHRDDVAAVVSPAPAAPVVDVAGIATAINAANQGQIAMLTELVKGLIARPEVKPEKGPDVLEIVTALAPILKPSQSEGGVAESMKLFREGLSMGRELAGDGGGEGDTFTNLALKGMDMVTKVAAVQPQRQVQRRPQAQPARLAAPLAENPPGTVAATDAPAKQELPPMLKLLNWLKQQTQLLVHQAKRKKNPGLYAELFLDNLPDGITLEQMYEKLAAESWLQDLADVTGNAEVLQHAAWFTEFRKEVLESLTPDDDEANAGAIDVANYEPPEGGEVIEHGGES